MKNHKTIVIAFDGLDLELVREFGLENIPQGEFGKIDNQTGITKTFTSELFASFITGKTHEDHGVKGLKKWTNPRIENFENWVEGSKFFEKFKNLRRAVFESINSFDAVHRKYKKEDLEEETIFEKVENSRAMFVPSYNPSPYWMIGADSTPLKYGYTPTKLKEMYDTREFSYRKKALFSELQNDFTPTRDFLMCHFHRADTHQHLYGDESLSASSSAYDEEKLRKLYTEMDELAGKIKQKAEKKGYTRIIFMSDHGRPSGKSHNENAFYSSNKNLFDDEVPKITDFYSFFDQDGEV